MAARQLLNTARSANRLPLERPLREALAVYGARLAILGIILLLSLLLLLLLFIASWIGRSIGGAIINLSVFCGSILVIVVGASWLASRLQGPSSAREARIRNEAIQQAATQAELMEVYERTRREVRDYIEQMLKSNEQALNDQALHGGSRNMLANMLASEDMLSSEESLVDWPGTLATEQLALERFFTETLRSIEPSLTNSGDFREQSRVVATALLQLRTLLYFAREANRSQVAFRLSPFREASTSRQDVEALRQEVRQLRNLVEEFSANLASRENLRREVKMLDRTMRDVQRQVRQLEARWRALRALEEERNREQSPE
jgi:hypothetical protein